MSMRMVVVVRMIMFVTVVMRVVLGMRMVMVVRMAMTMIVAVRMRVRLSFMLIGLFIVLLMGVGALVVMMGVIAVGKALFACRTPH